MDKSGPQWAVIEMLKKLGADIKEINFPDSIFYPFPIVDPIINAESAAAFDDFTRSDLDDQLTGQRKFDWPNGFRAARFIPAVEYINANRHRYALIENFFTFMKDYDVIVVPSFGGRQLSITNLTGNPVVCAPIGLNERGLPRKASTFFGKAVRRRYNTCGSKGLPRCNRLSIRCIPRNFSEVERKKISRHLAHQITCEGR